MPLFPDRVHEDCGAYADRYFERLSAAAATIDHAALDSAARLLIETVDARRMVFSCGNGGSAAIANHLVCDHMKGIRADTGLAPRVASFSTTVELITAIANDIGVEDIYAYQVRAMAVAGDVLIAISSSGASPNILRALEDARAMGVRTIAMTGFSGGGAADLADISLHVAEQNYGIVEDIHQSMMHILAQYIRHGHVDAALLGSLKF